MKLVFRTQSFNMNFFGSLKGFILNVHAHETTPTDQNHVPVPSDALLVVSKLRVLGEHDVTNWSQGVILMIFWDVDKTNLKVVPDLGGFPQPTFHWSTISACFTGFSPHKKQ